MPKRVTDYRKTLLEGLRDPSEAALYLEAALEDSDEIFLIALRDVAEAHQMAKVAEHAGISREALYRMLCDKGNPTYKNLGSILSAVGLRLTVAPLEGGNNDPSARLGSTMHDEVYAHAAHLEWTLYDVRIRFGQLLFRQSDEVPQAKLAVDEGVAVTLAWPEAKFLRDALSDLIARHEKVNGEIKPPILTPGG